ncbi:MAG TPA: VOC family protein [Opitutaceae bacterium]|jgi:catechol 2,3-dioxygenase-like lactoylglutathione lyase family enzyme
MKFEHFALNVPDVRAMAAWYVDHLDATIARQRPDEPYTHFLADPAGRVFIELYTNPLGPIPAFASAHPLSFHFAFVSSDALASRARLELAGASLVVEERLADGSLLVMMRDPWGVPFQLCQRAKPF